MDIISFGFGLTVGFICGCVPDLIKQYAYRKSLESLGDNELSLYRPLDEYVEDPDDIIEREKREEADIGFF